MNDHFKYAAQTHPHIDQKYIYLCYKWSIYYSYRLISSISRLLILYAQKIK